MQRRHASPFRLNLDQQRKRAKELLKAFRDGDAAAMHRFQQHHPNPPVPPARLSEAQLVIARELGLPSWPRLKAHIEAMDQCWTRIAQGEAAPDRDMATLHIRCGSDIAPALREAGFIGDFLEYSDPFCQGPVIDGADWLERRLDFLLRAYGAGSGMTREDIAAKLHGEEAGLAAAARYERIVLWFEHDSYDQLILARCLAAFAVAPPLRLELISPARYPGGMRFIGLGQLPPEALRLLWEDERRPVPDAARRSGQEAWRALRAADPHALADLARRGTPVIPQLGRALRRHCQELPWTRDGLGLSQRLILQLIAEGPRPANQVFHDLMMQREPLPWMTDLIFHDIVEGMRGVDRPVFAGRHEREDRRWSHEILTITPLGRAVLAGDADWLSLRPPPRWVGGVAIMETLPCWRWDDETGSVVRQDP